jgi:hypothetical protein
MLLPIPLLALPQLRAWLLTPFGAFPINNIWKYFCLECDELARGASGSGIGIGNPLVEC